MKKESDGSAHVFVEIAADITNCYEREGKVIHARLIDKHTGDIDNSGLEGGDIIELWDF